MNHTLHFFATPTVAFFLAYALIPSIGRLARKIGLVDRPNARKVHQAPVPVIGGVSIFVAAIGAMCMNSGMFHEWKDYTVLLVGSFILLVMGIIDDKVDLGAKLKLVIQLGISYYVFSSGIRIESLFGVFGIHGLPHHLQFVLTMVVITGTVNAFNLTDGIDGLAAGLAIIGFAVFAVLSFFLGKPTLTLIFLTVIFPLMAFLRFNLSRRKKVFMGDAGSLMLGFLLVASGIMLIQDAEGTAFQTTSLLSVVGVLILPVFDSLRVYRARLKTGYSPFRADRTHLHHLLLSFELEHYLVSSTLIGVAIAVLFFMLVAGFYFSLTVTLALFVLLFGSFSRLMAHNHQLQHWDKKVRDMEAHNGSSV